MYANSPNAIELCPSDTIARLGRIKSPAKTIAGKELFLSTEVVRSRLSPQLVLDVSQRQKEFFNFRNRQSFGRMRCIVIN